MKRSIIAISLLTAFSFFASFRTSNCAPVDQETGFKSAEKDGEYWNSDSGEADTAVQSDRNGIAFVNAAHCFKHLIDQKLHVPCNHSLLLCHRSIGGTMEEGSNAKDVAAQQKRDRRQVTSGQKIKLPKALELVEQYGLKECVARTSCELACNPNLYGRIGRSLYRFMSFVYRRNRIAGVSAAAIDFYRSSITAGARLKGQNCKDECKSQYAGCTRQTSVLLRMASHIDLSI